MRKTVLLILLAALLLGGCAEEAQPVESSQPDIFYSDQTAIAFLDGYWTNGLGEYLTAAPGDGGLIRWETNIPLPSCELYILKEGVLTGGSSSSQGGVEQQQLLRFEKLDENSISIENLNSGESSTFIRDSLEPDPERLDNDYVFWTMNRASVYLQGMWMDENGSYFVLSVDENGAVSWNSDLDIPDCDYIDFYDGQLCAVTLDDQGGRTFVPALTFDIQDKNSVLVLCHSTGLSSCFQRLSSELDSQLLDSRYIFANPQRAFVFLEGLWLDGKGNYFSVENKGGNVRWNTNLSLPNYQSYTFAQGSMVGVNTDAQGQEKIEPIYDFTVISQDELEISISGTDDVYLMQRQK